MNRSKRLALMVALGTGATMTATLAEAQTTTVACDDATTLPNPVYMAGSSAFEPILMQLAIKMKEKQNISIIYSPIASCNGTLSVADATQTLSGTAHYYVGTSTSAQSCNVAAGTKALIGVSDVAYDSCPSLPATSTLIEQRGPVQAMLLVVPELNITTTALSYQQAAAIWGCGAKGNQSPFIDEVNAIQQRKDSSGTQILVAKNIGVPPSAFKGKTNDTGGNLVTSLLAVADPQTAIGFLAADAYASKRSTLNAVAFQGVGQTKAYYADSDANSVDKKNVRDGHYVIQGPLHFFTPSVAGQPSATAKKVLDYLTGAVPIDPTDTSNTNYITTVATLGDVPQCAMKVQLNKDGGQFSPFTPPVSCHCFFDQAVTKSTTPPAGCVACTSDAQCTGGKRCQTGYCE